MVQGVAQLGATMRGNEMPYFKEIGDTSRDGLLRIVETIWDHNGGLHVTIEETMGGHCLIGGFPIRRARTLARSALPEYYKGQTRKSPVINRWYDQGCEKVTFLVSRND
jgi:hypothetical protein